MSSAYSESPVATTPVHMEDVDDYRTTRVSVSAITDPGGPGRVNQDAYFTLCDEASGAMVLGIFDGHGKETGCEAANSAKMFFKNQFEGYSKADYARLEENPERVFQQMYVSCHLLLRGVLRSDYERRGYEVTEVYPAGFLMRKDRNTHEYACIRGGTTVTVVVILDGGRKIITSNVGDSTAILGVDRPVLRSTHLKVFGDNSGTRTDNDQRKSDADSAREESTLVLTGDHAADSESEFQRVRTMDRCKNDTKMPALRFLYDTADPRNKRMPIFHVSHQDEVGKHANGDYYKNVRDEWATVVAAPADSRFPDALAFTRSVGDFHMHAYGVCCEPTVTQVSLESILDKYWQTQRSNQEDAQEAPYDHTTDDSSDNNAISPISIDSCPVTHHDKPSSLHFMLVVASDGIWDNWKYSELFSYLLGHPDSSKAAQPRISDPIDKVAGMLMNANLRRAATIFGDQADNMTAVLCHLHVTTSRT